MVGRDTASGVVDGRVVGPLEEIVGGKEEGCGGNGRLGVAAKVLAPTVVGGESDAARSSELSGLGEGDYGGGIEAERRGGRQEKSAVAEGRSCGRWPVRVAYAHPGLGLIGDAHALVEVADGVLEEEQIPAVSGGGERGRVAAVSGRFLEYGACAVWREEGEAAVGDVREPAVGGGDHSQRELAKEDADGLLASGLPLEGCVDPHRVRLGGGGEEKQEGQQCSQCGGV